MDIYKCIDCNTKRYLIFPNKNETFIICSACYRIRQEKEEERKDFPSKPLYRIFH
jgi:hypothetical protein